jgi:hypothetical protein
MRKPGLTFVLLALLASGSSAGAPDAETRVLQYLRDHLEPGRPLQVTQLYNQVFTQPDERHALDKLYNAFFRIPLFLAEYQQKTGSPPHLKVIAEQFDLHSPGAADTLLRVMESDPRVPHFLTRDARTGEITHVDVQTIKADPHFGQALSRQLAPPGHGLPPRAGRPRRGPAAYHQRPAAVDEIDLL